MPPHHVPGLLLAAGLGLLVAAVAAQQAAELLLNPTLEGAGYWEVSLDGGSISGALPNSWEDYSAWGGPALRIVYSVDTASPPQNGTQSLRADVTSGSMQMGQALTLQAGTAYRGSIWLRGLPPPVGGAGAGAPLLASLSLRLAAEPHTDFGTATAILGGGWQQLEVPIAQLPGKALMDPPLAVQLLVQLPQPGTLWLDSAALTTLAASQPAALPLPPPPPTPVGLPFFGLCAQHLHAVSPAPVWPSLPFGVFRTWGSGVTWASIQPRRRGEFDWSWLDEDVRKAEAAGQQVIVTMGQTPRWASSRPDEPSALGPGLAAPPYDISDWETYVAEMARRYKGRIFAYEVWNEPDLQGPQGYFSGSPEELAALGRAAASMLHFHDPQAVLLTPAIASGSAYSLSWLDRYLRAGGWEGARGVAVSLQNPVPELDVGMVQTLRQLLAAQGLEWMPLYQVLQYDLRQPGASTAGAAAYLAQSYLIDQALGFSTVLWYAYDAWGLEGLLLSLGPEANDPSRLSEAGAAYARLQRWLLGAKVRSLARRSDGVWVGVLRREGGAAGGGGGLPGAAPGEPPPPALSRVLWSVEGPMLFEVPGAWEASYAQELVSGRVTSLQPGNGTTSASVINLGPQPLLVAQA